MIFATGHLASATMNSGLDAQTKPSPRLARWRISVQTCAAGGRRGFRSMTMAKAKKKVEPLLAWGLVRADGTLWRDAIRTRAEARSITVPGERVVRVRISVVEKGKVKRGK